MFSYLQLFIVSVMKYNWLLIFVWFCTLQQCWNCWLALIIVCCVNFRISMYRIMLFVIRDSFTYSFLICMPYFTWLISLSAISSKILNSSTKMGILVLFIILRWKKIHRFSIEYGATWGFSYKYLSTCWRNSLLFLFCWSVFILKGCSDMLDAFHQLR